MRTNRGSARTRLLLAATLVAATLAATGSPSQADQDVRTAAGQSVTVDKVKEIAAETGHSLAQVTQLLRDDASMRLDAKGRLYHADRVAKASATSSASVVASSPDHPLADTFKLHSRRGSKKVIYLDFTGERVCDTEWNRGGLLGLGALPCGTYEGYDVDGRSGFSNAERALVQEVWARVAEDYAPFDVDVTTERPAAWRINRSSAGDDYFGVHGVVSSSTTARDRTCGGPGCAGVAYVGIFDEPKTDGQRIFWAFPEELGNQPRRLADVLSHEAGHTLNLLHDGNAVAEYDQGHGIWAPLMGSSDRALTQWSRGEYQGANNRQDDLSVIATNGARYKADDHSRQLSSGTRLNPSSTRSGVIGRSSDVDVFRLRTRCRGTVNVAVRNVRFGPNLDIRLRIYNSRGRLVTTRNPTSSSSGMAGGLDADFRGIRPVGTTYLVIDGTGARDPRTTGYSGYGSLGRYGVRYTSTCGRRW
ncbi:MAG TPA: hypothetical protein VIR30_08390 [Nocardioides sp.]